MHLGLSSISASQGLGKQILSAFALSGAHGAVLDLSLNSSKNSIEKIKTEVRDAGLPPPKLRAYECDTSSEEAVKSTFAQIVKDFGKVDIVCTNAGITGGAPAENYGLEDWKKMFEVNVHGSFLVARDAGKHMLEKDIKGSIIMVSSMSGSIVNQPQKQSAYNAVRQPDLPFSRAAIDADRILVQGGRDPNDEVVCGGMGSPWHPRQYALAGLYPNPC
jgi:sorbose reductase